ncbi:hypothetical protein BGZ76_004606 [Entomortierella beljakovae]|nr:hypothetical protein BGZ76_004606 [Entomortierella beljakovae]
MGCSGSKDADHETTQQEQMKEPAYDIPQQMIPPSTLPHGWISQYDPSKQHLYYVFPQTSLVTWEHPLGQQAGVQEMARFHQIQQQAQQQQQQQKQQGIKTTQNSFANNYNRLGGMGPGAAMAMGAIAGGTMALMAGGLMTDSMEGGIPEVVPAMDCSTTTDYGYSGADGIVPASSDFSGGGGGDFVSAAFDF